MIPDYLKPIINQLAEKTRNDLAIWTPSSGVKGFKLRLQKSMVIIDKWMNEEFYAWMIDFKILNDRGDEIESFQFQDNENKAEFTILNELYELIYTKYYKVEETLQNLMDELGNDKKIGSPDPEDQLPR